MKRNINVDINKIYDTTTMESLGYTKQSKDNKHAFIKNVQVDDANSFDFVITIKPLPYAILDGGFVSSKSFTEIFSYFDDEREKISEEEKIKKKIEETKRNIRNNLESMIEQVLKKVSLPANELSLKEKYRMILGNIPDPTPLNFTYQEKQALIALEPTYELFFEYLEVKFKHDNLYDKAVREFDKAMYDAIDEVTEKDEFKKDRIIDKIKNDNHNAFLDYTDKHTFKREFEKLEEKVVEVMYELFEKVHAKYETSYSINGGVSIKEKEKK